MARSSSAPGAVLVAVLAALPGRAGAAAAPPGHPGAASAPAGEAETLFTDARRLMVEKNYLQACPKLERSEALDPQIGTEFNLARCYELGGLLASAWLTYTHVIQETRAAGQVEREAVARQLAASLAPRVAHARIQLAPGAARPGMEIRCDGVVLPERSFDQARPVDPGTHVVEASAPGVAPWRSSFMVDRDGQVVDVEVPALGWPALASPLAPLPAAVQAPPRGRRQRELAAILGGVSLVGIGIGTYYGLRTASLSSEARPLCDGAVCDPRAFATMDEARKDGNVSTVAFTMAATLLAGAAVVWLTAPRSSASSAP